MQTAHHHFICPVNNANQSASNTKNRAVAIRRKEKNPPLLPCQLYRCTVLPFSSTPQSAQRVSQYFNTQGSKFPPVYWSKTTKTDRPVELSLPLVQWTSNCYTNVNSFKMPQNDVLSSCRRTVFARLKRIRVNKLLGIIQ